MIRSPHVASVAVRLAAPILFCAAGAAAGVARGADPERPAVDRGPAGAPALVPQPATRPADVSAPAAAQPAGPPIGPTSPPARPAARRGNRPDESFLLGQRRQRDNGRNEYADMADGGEVAVADLLRLSLAGGALRVEPTPRVGPEAERFRVAGTAAVCTVALVPLPGAARNRGDGGASITFTRHDADVTNDADVWMTTLSVNPGGDYLSVIGQSVLGRVMLSQNLSPPQPAARGAPQQPVTLTVTEWQAGPQLATVFRASAGTLAELRARYPDEFRRHVVPTLAKASDLRWLVPGPAEAYRVFGEIPADPAVTARLQALLPDLDADAYPVRQAAAKRLMDLGPAGVLAALRTDPATLSDEQKGQLGRLVAAHRRRDLPDPNAARSDPAFLADCLEHEDPAVRRAAKASLEKVLGRAVGFDADAPPEARAAAADAVRTSVLDPASDPAAATQPGARPAAGATAPAEVPPDQRAPAIVR